MAVPSPLTQQQLRNSILRFLKRENDTTAEAQADDAIRAAISHLGTRPYKSLVTTSTLTLTTGSNQLTLPADFNMAFSLHKLDTNSKRDGRLVFRSEEDFDAFHPNVEGVNGKPWMWTVRHSASVLELDRTPDTDEVTVHPTVRLRYIRRINTLTTDTATFDIPPEFEQFIIWHGRMELSAIYKSEVFPMAQAERSRTLADLSRHNTVRDEQDWI